MDDRNNANATALYQTFMILKEKSSDGKDAWSVKEMAIIKQIHEILINEYGLN